MEPGLLTAIAQLLLNDGRVFEAERLLHQGLARWPENVDIARRWAGIAVRLNRVEAARPVLERFAPTSTDPSLHYLLGVATIRREPRTEADLRATLAAWEKVVALDPNYIDADGSKAEEIRNAIAKLKADLPASPDPAPAPAPPSGAPSAAP